MLNYLFESTSQIISYYSKKVKYWKLQKLLYLIRFCSESGFGSFPNCLKHFIILRVSTPIYMGDAKEDELWCLERMFN